MRATIEAGKPMHPGEVEKLTEMYEATTPARWLADGIEEQGSDGRWGVWHLDSGGPICFVGDPYPRGDNHPGENMAWIAAIHNRWPDVAATVEAQAKQASKLAGVLMLYLGSCDEADAGDGCLCENCCAAREVLELPDPLEEIQ